MTLLGVWLRSAMRIPSPTWKRHRGPSPTIIPSTNDLMLSSNKSGDCASSHAGHGLRFDGYLIFMASLLSFGNRHSCSPLFSLLAVALNRQVQRNAFRNCRVVSTESSPGKWCRRSLLFVLRYLFSVHCQIFSSPRYLSVSDFCSS